jgi:hypothetical protein
MHKSQIDKARAREERRRANLAAVRERERARAKAEARRLEDEAQANAARAALAGWSHVKIERHGGFWVAAGRAPDGGPPFATTDADPAAAAQRILAEAETQRTARLRARNDGAGAGEDAREDVRRCVEGLARPEARGPARPMEPPANDDNEGRPSAEPNGGAHAGILIERDEIARLRLALSMEVDRTAAARIAQRNPNDAADVERARDLNNLLMLGLITEAQREELDGLNARVGWARQVEEVARAAKRAIAEAQAEALGRFDVAGIEWPE